MMVAMPSEAEIRKVVATLKSQPAKFQVLAESVMRIKFGGVYSSLTPQGRNAELQTTIGYPDVYAKDKFGKLYLVEATVGNWRGHLEDEDVPGITRIGGANVAEFALFCMSNSELLIEQERKDRKVSKKSVDAYKAELAALGVPLAGIRIFFLDQLVTELRQPVYARVLFDLGMDIDISPFCSIEKRLFVSDAGPTREEFESGGVVADDLIDSMRRLLNPGSKLVVEARSGLGKTTLSTAFAFDWLKREQGAFYVDLAAFNDPSAIIHVLVQKIKQYGCRSHLFVLDNGHRLAPEFLAQVLDACVDPNDRPTILVMTRPLAQPIAQALCLGRGLERMQLSLRREDLLAVYWLLARRCSQSKECTPPTDTDVSHWQKLHADLVTFSLALKGGPAKASLSAGLVPKLSESDAIDYLRTRYLKDLPTEEHDMFAVIALCARYGVPASETSLNGVPNQSLERGLLFQLPAKNHVRRYALHHAKIGQLLLKCLNVNEQEVWKTFMQRDSFQACFIAQRLLHGDNEAMDTQQEGTLTAKDVLEQVGANAWKFSPSFSPGYAGVIASLYRQVGLQATFKTTLNSEISKYIADHDSFLIGLPSFLDYANAEGFDSEVSHVWTELCKTAQGGRLERAACLAPVPTVHNMLVGAAKYSTEVRDELVKAFSSKALATAIANKFGKLKPDLAEEVLASFEKLTPHLYSSLLQELALGSRLGELKGTLMFAKSPAAVKYWLRQRRLLRLLTSDPALTLPKDWLNNNGAIVLQLLLGELEELRAEHESQIQDLIATWAGERIVATPNPVAAAIRLRLMMCTADMQRGRAVSNRINKTNPETLKACLSTQNPVALGTLLIGAAPVFAQTKALSRVKDTILTITRERIEKSTALRASNWASHLFVAELAGAKREEPWLQPALETLGRTQDRQIDVQRDRQRGVLCGELQKAYREGVAALLGSLGQVPALAGAM